MKKLLNLTVLVLCMAVVMAQLVHVSTAEASNCDTVRSEQHISHDVAAKADTHGEPSGKTFCCESCHVHLITMPFLSVQAEAVMKEQIASHPNLVINVSPDTLSEPPQA